MPSGRLIEMTIVACHVEEDVIVFVLQSALESVDSVGARFAEQLSKSR